MNVIQGSILGALVIFIGLLISGKFRPSSLFGAMVILAYLSGSIEMPQVMAGFTNPSLITLILLLLISITIEKTRLISWIGRQLSTGHFTVVVAKLGFSTALLSSFTNNTAVVASLIGAVKRNNTHAPTKLLIPLSYAAIFGGTLTLIGTSTNLIVNSFVVDAGLPPLGFFEFSIIGLAGFLAGMVVLITMSHRLPDHSQDDSEELVYFLEAHVKPNSALVGRTIAENNLRALKQLYLAEILRNDEVICPVCPEEILQANDQLLFCGDVDSVGVLQDIKGLKLFGQGELNGQHLVEVIVSHSSKLNGLTLKESKFRAHFDSVVVAIRRGHSPLRGGLGNVRLRAGDTLLLAPGAEFKNNKDLNRDFVVVSGLDAATRLSDHRSIGVLAGFVTTIALALTGTLPLLKGLVIFVLLLCMSGTLSLQEIRRRLPIDLWVVVGSALALSNMLQTTGVSDVLANSLLEAFNGWGVLAAFIATYFATLLLSELITNNAAAALAFPIAFSLAQSYGVSELPFIMAVIFGASASFISPYGYQTNLMVYSAGNYALSDYLKLGIPTSIVYSTVVLVMIPYVFPFYL
ncbi:SLC13 family permease [Moritella sp. Urea-trap-13]|uniref:SLC13 family permease n=1 Tax=Moritella sp. Urea-trap-13 TaxID=2058327 RepID=UPI000C3283F2|nr:SLC13 family permease [Moritella sp. Urea-trap-13]PKH07274.1 SLC13 family permease [Moritella sp. Urea-trap-13]